MERPHVRRPDRRGGRVAPQRKGPVVGFRFDMDALPVLEKDTPGHKPNRDGFRSRRDGFMHA